LLVFTGVDVEAFALAAEEDLIPLGAGFFVCFLDFAIGTSSSLDSGSGLAFFFDGFEASD
jgi:hypothetical protein